MSVDYSTLASRLGFEERYVEKACRISDLMQRISQVPFLRDRLSLYGGTALAFVFFPEVYRLSIDIDFNYRHIGEEDWGLIRDQVDNDMKRVLYSLRYEASNLSIDPSYPLGRITVDYISNAGLRDSFKVEVGYMRRIPILRNDQLSNYQHPAGGETFKVLTPRREELFANKWCTMLYRGSSRDLFDIYKILELPMDGDVFKACAVVDSLMRGATRLHEIDVNTILRGIPVDSALLNLLRRGPNEFSPSEAKERVTKFSERMLSDLTLDQINAINQFQDEAIFKPELIDKKGILNVGIKTHPMILRAIQNKK